MARGRLRTTGGVPLPDPATKIDNGAAQRSATGTGAGSGYGPVMGTTSEEPVGTQLLVGDADTELKAVLSAGLEAYNTAAIDAGEQR